MDDWRSLLVREFYSKIKEGDKVLDIGTGFLSNLELLLDTAGYRARIWSVDINERIIEQAKKYYKKWIERGTLHLLIADAQKLPFENETFDLTTSVMTFHHIKEIDRAVKEAIRVTKSGGNLVIVDWNPVGNVPVPHPKEELERSRKGVLHTLEGNGIDFQLKEFETWYMIHARI